MQIQTDFGEHFPSKHVTKSLQKRFRNFDREKVEKVENMAPALATFDLAARVGDPPYSRVSKQGFQQINAIGSNTPGAASSAADFQLSTTFRRGVKSWKTEKSQPFCPKLTYTSPRRKCTKLRKLRFIDFLFSKMWKDNSSKIEFSMKNDPIRFNFQLSTILRQGVTSWKTKKISAFLTTMSWIFTIR